MKTWRRAMPLAYLLACSSAACGDDSDGTGGGGAAGSGGSGGGGGIEAASTATSTADATASSTGSGPPVSCGRVDTTSGSPTCVNTYDDCAGQDYAFECVDGDCVCKVDGVEVAPADASTCPSNTPDVNALCGWNLL